MAHAARALSEDSPAAPAGRLAVEQGRVTVSDASRVMDEPAEVQLRALERVTGGGSRNLAGAAQGLPPGGWIAEVGEVISGAGPTPWRVWRTPALGVSPAGADMGGGAAVVVAGPERLRGWEAWHGVAGAPGHARYIHPAARRSTERRFYRPFHPFYGWGVLCR